LHTLNEIAAERIEADEKAISAEVTPTRKNEENHCVLALKYGLPREDSADDEVWDIPEKIAPTHIVRISLTRSLLFSAERDGKIIFTAKGERKYSPTAIIKEVKKLKNIALPATAIAPLLSPDE